MTYKENKTENQIISVLPSTLEMVQNNMQKDKLGWYTVRKGKNKIFNTWNKRL